MILSSDPKILKEHIYITVSKGCHHLISTDIHIFLSDFHNVQIEKHVRTRRAYNGSLVAKLVEATVTADRCFDGENFKFDVTLITCQLHNSKGIPHKNERL